MNLNTEIKIDKEGIKNALINFLVPILALGASVLLFFVVILPGLSNLPQLQAELSETETLEGILGEKLSTLNRLLDFESVVEEYGDLFRSALPDESKVPELLTQVDQMARESGLAVIKLSYSIADAASLGEQVVPYNFVVINLGTLGTYDQVTAFLAIMENAARLVDVVNFRFASEPSAGSGIYSGTFILRAPYQFVDSQAVTDVPVTIDINDPRFGNVLDMIKQLRIYDITASSQFLNVEESSVEEVVQTEETQEATVSE